MFAETAFEWASFVELSAPSHWARAVATLSKLMTLSSAADAILSIG